MKRKTTIILFLGLFNWLLVEAQSVTPIKDSVSNDPGVVLMTQANAAFDKADYASAAKLYDQALNLFKTSANTKGAADAQYNMARTAVRTKDYSSARKLFEESLVLKRDLGDKKTIAACLFSIGQMCLIQHDYSSARRVFEESLELRKDIQDKKGIGWSYNALGVVRYINNEYDSARLLFRESYAMVKEIGDKAGITFSTNNLANTNYILGNYSDALSLELESLQTAVDLNHKLYIATSLAGLGAIFIETGKPTEGSKLLGVCDSQLEALQAVLATEDQRFYDKGATSAISRLGKDKFEQAKVEGRTMTMEQAIIFAQTIAKK